VTTSETPTQSTPPRGVDGSPSSDSAPKLAEGVELIGQYEDSGFKDPPYMARRSDGQVVQLPELLYAVVEESNGQSGYAEIADRVGDRIGREVSEDNVRYLVDEKLRPLGVLAGKDGSSPKIAKTDQLLALKFRVSVIPDRVVKAITTVFYPLFFPPVILAALAGLAALDVWLFGIHGVGQSARELLYKPGYLLLVLGLVVVSAAFHECGHATACRYGGAKPGVMGAGIYIVWPAFYTDVTDAYRLGRGGRLRTDLGGVYFNAIFSLVTAGAYFATGFEPLLVIIVLQHLEMLHQFLPFLRLDGYYIISDLTGVPDMFARIKPTLRSLVPGRKPEKSVAALKPWVRVATTGYVLALIPVLALVFGFMLVSAPRIFATAWDSMFVQGDKISDAISNGRALVGLAAGFQFLSLLLPVAGITLTFGRTLKRLVFGAWSWSEDSPLRRTFVVLAAGAAAGAAAFTLWPNGEYKPIQPGERGTVTGGVQALSEFSGGRPALPEEREQELVEENGEIQTERSRNDEVDRSEPDAPTPGGTTSPTETNEAPQSSTTPTTTSPASTTPSETTTTPSETTTTPSETTTTPSETTPTPTTTTETTP
jgi:putative peptide zinc metalloprotease protein